MKIKRILTICTLCLCMINSLFANAYNISQVSNVKSILNYSKNTNIDLLDIVTLGSYPQSDISGNTKEPIEWIVIKNDGNKALLLSKYVLDYRWYNDDTSEFTTWEDSELRKWLNSDFYNDAFNTTEKQSIINEKNITKKYSDERGTIEYQITTNDYVTCLDEETIMKIFGYDIFYLGPAEASDNENKLLIVTPTEYAKNKQYYGKENKNMSSQRHKLYVPNNLNCSYLLRTNNRVNRFGTVGISNLRNYSTEPGVRPAIWVKVDNLNVNNGLTVEAIYTKYILNVDAESSECQLSTYELYKELEKAVDIELYNVKKRDSGKRNQNIRTLKDFLSGEINRKQSEQNMYEQGYASIPYATFIQDFDFVNKIITIGEAW